MRTHYTCRLRGAAPPLHKILKGIVGTSPADGNFRKRRQLWQPHMQVCRGYNASGPARIPTAPPSPAPRPRHIYYYISQTGCAPTDRKKYTISLDFRPLPRQRVPTGANGSQNICAFPPDVRPLARQRLPSGANRSQQLCTEEHVEK